MRELDPRAWNLFVGLSLAAGCSVPAQSDDAEASGTEASGGTETSGETTTGDGDGEGETTTGEDTETSDDTTTGDGDDGETTDGPCACEDDEDCENSGCGEICCLGYCVSDSPCYSYNCGTFELCQCGECKPIGEPIPNCGFGYEFAIPTVHELGAPPLALSFVDVDDDGEDELVVATETELLVYEFGSDVATVSPRMPGVAEQARMVAGQFDGQPGEDITLLVAGEYHRYFSDSVGGLVSPIIEPCPLVNAEWLVAGEFDAHPPTDLLIWGNNGAMLDLTSTTVLLNSQRIGGAAAYEHGTPNAGVLLARGTSLMLYDLAGNVRASAPIYASDVGALPDMDLSKYFTVDKHDPYFHQWWYEVRVRDAMTLEQLRLNLFENIGLVPEDDFYVEGGIVAADFDGDQQSDILASFGKADPLQFMLRVSSQPCMVVHDLGPEPVAHDIAIGDHDGDGDDEAALMQGDRVVILDLD